MSILSKLFGSGKGKPAAADPVEYQGFLIFPEPIKEDGQYRIAARIEKGDKVHQLIRADLIRDLDEANEASLGKARQMIDQLGESLFKEW
ncbi:HlyU family transcriptional regulator [Tropicibacter alexandrii]|uniref:HlyU family transcriptional regulator n=1 Tax=Tropicibacter alexandrii TaxID=2267683 RepID=UPI000EF45B47|nr:HlyU family transcriptional regulator [Tropicibacter alexandrii]